MEMLGAMGLSSPAQLAPHHIFRRVDDLRVRNMQELYESLEPGQLLDDDHIPDDMREEWTRPAATAGSWRRARLHGGDELREEEESEAS
ncbi:MAG: hypothetical protein U5R48_08845 [Gammaproteobacteria bacterium]|nr:hypothetical protein [Gammaproteobacteria bacterium]